MNLRSHKQETDKVHRPRCLSLERDRNSPLFLHSGPVYKLLHYSAVGPGPSGAGRSREKVVEGFDLIEQDYLAAVVNLSGHSSVRQCFTLLQDRRCSSNNPLIHKKSIVQCFKMPEVKTDPV